MTMTNFAPLTATIRSISSTKRSGFASGTNGNTINVKGLSDVACVGDFVRIVQGATHSVLGEVLTLTSEHICVLPEKGTGGISLNDRVDYVGSSDIAPDESWLGRIIDPFGRALDGRPLMRGLDARPVLADPPAAAKRGRLGERLETGMAAFNTYLPIVRGQRMGLFAGSGVGKSTLLANLSSGIEADFVVIALIGERGRELREFVEDTLGPEGLKRAVVIAATSDQSPMVRRRAAWTAMTVAEYLRDQGGHVLFLADSVTRFAEAHREIAAASGEASTARGFPPSTSQIIMSLCERAGPGPDGCGDITGVFSVLVSGSDMEEPLADIVRGVLDGHVVLDRQIAERGRFPAVDILRSVSRSLPNAASDDENQILASTRELMATYAEAELMIQAGLYSSGTDPKIDSAVDARPKLEALLAMGDGITTSESFKRLADILKGPRRIVA
ncbi:MAG: FliI/YscN family ATPase [Litoreibacter sp.]